MTSYDEVPYESHPFPQSHPDRLATVATLFGMQPAPVDGCRVLELGSASGGNLIPMAFDLPGSSFVGVDLSKVEIEDGKRVVEALGLSNVDMRAASIMDVDDGWGRFDYVIAHGVYSWVPPDVQAKILDVCASLLAPEGVAYISYNTYPGWHLRGMIRDMMVYHAGRFTEVDKRVGQARALLDFLARSVSAQESPYAAILKQELESIRGKQDSYLLHEHLEDFNEPLYFHQFSERVVAAGLRYLGEAQVSAMAANDHSAEVQATLRRLSSNQIHAEQYMDFLRNRMFRQTLLCRQDVSVNHQLKGEQVADFMVASAARPEHPDLDPRGPEAQSFTGPGGVTLTTSDPLLKAALLALAKAWPRAIPFDRLRDDARDRIAQAGGPPSKDTSALGGRLLNAYTSSNLVELRLHQPAFTTSPGERPEASALARLHAERGTRVTNRRHESVALSDAERRTIRLLDGKRDREAILEELLVAVSRGELEAKRADRPLFDPAEIREVTSNALTAILDRLARSALLVG